MGVESRVFNVNEKGIINYITDEKTPSKCFRLVHRDDESCRDRSLWDAYYKGDLLTECEDIYNVYTDWILAWSDDHNLDFVIEARHELHDDVVRAFTYVLDAHRGLKAKGE